MKIKKTEAYYTSSNGFTGIHCCIWQDTEKEPKALFQIAHGVSEHINRYNDFAEFLAAHGYIVFGNDHLGHGQSVFEDNEYGYFGALDGDKRLVDDMHILSLIMKKRYPDLPLVLLGHSMGSFCARVYAADFKDEIVGLILSGTSEIPASAVALQGPVNFLCDRLGPQREVDAKVLDKISTLGIKNKSTDKDWLSVNALNVAEYLNDPLCGKNFKLGGIRDILSLATSACSTVWAKKLSKDLKILIVSGTDDPIGFKGKGITALCDNLEEEEFDPDVILYPGMRHEILNEDDNMVVYSDILRWTDNLFT